MMAFDVDGILTNGQLLYTDEGTEIKAFDTRDGLGFKLLREAGIKLAIITARRSELVERRARELGVHFCYQGSEAKLSAFQEILTELKLDGAQAGYMGDDLVDLPVLIRAGFAATVPEAVDAVRERCHYVTSRSGGRGAVREVCEMILRAQGHFDRALAEYLK
jgi:3-deoxy-D-manno-octulosonate 8-phosphate phosphatase (KDO 8-P phosphatase)